MPLTFTPATIFQIILILLDVYAAVVAFVLFFEKSAHSILVSFVIIGISVVDIWTMISTFPFISYIEFIRNYIGKGILYIIVGCLFSSTYGVRLASWIMFWFVGIICIIFNFTNLARLTPIVSTGEPTPVADYNYEKPNEYGQLN